MPVVDRARVVAALPGYTVGDELGAGTSGLVLLGRHLDLDRKVAIKVLSATSTGVAAGIDFRVEARLLSRLEHPHIVRIYDYVGQGELCLLVMELLGGGTLNQRRLAPEGVLAVGLAIADALTRAHGSGVLHRDVKPDNILFTTTGQPKITDFGIAKILDGTVGTTSQIVGTPRYMAPEQIVGGGLGPGTDVYALAVVLYEQLTGGSLFAPSLTIPELFRHHCEVPPRHPAGVPDPVARILMRGLAKHPADRPGSAHEFAFDLSVAAASAYGRHWASRSGIMLHVSDQLRDPTAPKVVAAQPPPLPRPGLATTTDLGGPGGFGTGPPHGPPVVTTPPGAASAAPETTPATPARPPSRGVAAARSSWRQRRLVLAAAATAITTTLGVGVVLAVQSQSSDQPGGQAAGVDPTADATGGPAGGGPARPVQLSQAADVVVDAAGALYFADDANHRVLRRDPRGEVSVVAGTGRQGSSGDNGPADEATLNTPRAIAVDADGNLYIAETGSGRIRLVDDDDVITTIAGGGDDPADDGAPVAATEAQLRLDRESDLAVDTAGNVYFCEADDIRRITRTGMIMTLPDYGASVTVAGVPPDPGTTFAPTRLATDQLGNLFVTYRWANQVWRVDASGVATRFAGTGADGFAGDGGPATEASLDFGFDGGDLAVDPAGNVYVADEENHRIRQIGLDRVIRTIAGSGLNGRTDDGQLAVDVRLYSPRTVEIDGAGNIYVGEFFNESIRKVSGGFITTVVE